MSRLIEKDIKNVEYIKQNNPECLPVIQEIGCFFRCACHLAELVTRKVLSAADLNFLWEECKKLKLINDNDDVQDSAKIANIALSLLWGKGRFIEIGLKKDNITALYRWAQNTGLKPNYWIKKINQGGKHKTHFDVVNENEKIIFDPHFPNIASKGDIYTICYYYES